MDAPRDRTIPRLRVGAWPAERRRRQIVKENGYSLMLSHLQRVLRKLVKLAANRYTDHHTSRGGSRRCDEGCLSRGGGSDLNTYRINKHGNIVKLVEHRHLRYWDFT
eukprot:2073771-Pleurochrysis_carterae.AAC.1